MRAWLSFVVFVLPAFLAAQTSTTAIQPGSVDGRVTNAQTGEPIPRVRVQLSPAMASNRGQLPPARNITSQADGSFTFETVAPGIYFLMPQKQGFVYLNQAGSTQTVNVGAGQQVSDVNLQMTPEGSIAGKVTDDEGAPLAGIRIEAMSVYMLRGQMQLRQTATAFSDAQGNFKTENLPAGKYYLAGEPNRTPPRKDEAAQNETKPVPHDPDQPAYDFVRTFYPRVPDFESATPLDVGSGQDVSDITIRMRKGATYTIRGKVNGLPERAAADPSITLADRDGGTAMGITVRAQPDKTFEISKVQPGHYTLRMTGSDSGIYASPAPARVRVLARQDVDVTSSDVEGIALVVQPPIILTGRVSVAGMDTAINPAQIRINVLPAETLSYSAFSNATIKPDGTFTIENLDPGKYFIRAYNAPNGTYIRSITFNGQDVSNSPVDLSAGGSGDVEVTVRGGTGEVDGTLQSSAAPASTVVLIPQNIPSDGSGIFFGQPRNGTFSIPNVPPGRYFAFALQRYDNSLWQNPDFVRSLEVNGATVDLDENGRAQIQLSTITQDQVRDAASRLGLTAR